MLEDVWWLLLFVKVLIDVILASKGFRCMFMSFALGGGNYTSNADSNGYFGEGKQLLPAAPCADPA